MAFILQKLEISRPEDYTRYNVTLVGSGVSCGLRFVPGAELFHATGGLVRI